MFFTLRFILFVVSVCLYLGCTDSQEEPALNNNETDTGTKGDDTNVDKDGGNDNNDSDNNDSDNGDDINDGGEDDDSEEEICLEWNVDINPVPVRIMIVQDLSSSMGQGTPTKWRQAQTALTTMLNNFNSAIEFGFDGFPYLAECAVAQEPAADAVPDNAKYITDGLGKLALTRSTPLYLAIKNYQKANYAPKFMAQGANRYLLVVSDGADSCGTTGTMRDGATPQQLGTITGALLTTKDLKTFVIGFGTGANPAQLNAIAAAGGTNHKQYINAQDQAALESALNDIAASVVSCIYEIGQQDTNEVNLDEVNFYFDDVLVGWDDGCALDKGWTWVDDAKTRVEFCKEACDKLKNNEVTEISATFGCPTEPVVQ
ncbi:MAG: VWA domain-containing protein [Proteobacteria bacterium]|nr:VWA domain-containing protein [Pseudomonadota bacterium]